MISIKIIAFFHKIWEKVMLVVTMATDVAIKIFTIIFLVLSGNDHSVKVSSNSEVGSGTALWDFFCFLRELVLKTFITFGPVVSCKCNRERSFGANYWV